MKNNISLQESRESKRTLLNLEFFDPQLWPIILDVLKDSVLNSYLRDNFENSTIYIYKFIFYIGWNFLLGYIK